MKYVKTQKKASKINSKQKFVGILLLIFTFMILVRLGYNKHGFIIKDKLVDEAKETFFVTNEKSITGKNDPCKSEEMHDIVIGLFINKYEFGLDI